MKQTAIQLLRESIDSEIKLGTKMVVNWDMYLEMEREQIITAFCKGYDHDGDNYDKAEIYYYDRTYKEGSNE